MEQIVLACRLVICSVILESFENNERIDLVAERIETHHDGENLFVLREIEILRAKIDQHLRHTVRIHQHASEHRLLRLKAEGHLIPLGQG